MENHSYGQIIGSPSAPYINSLLSSGSLATNYYGVSHPSLPNYLALAGGSTYGITSDCTTCWVAANNLGDTLEAAGRTWKTYQEAMPSACFVGDSYPYAQKHDPFIYFNDIRTNAARCQSHVVPYSRLATDLASTSTTPNYAFITPDMCHDMHDCAVGTGDAWLQQQVPVILGSPAFASQHSLLAITWDEDDSSSANRVATIFLGSSSNVASSSSTSYTHYSLLHTFESALGASTLTGNDAGAATMQDMFRTVSATPCANMTVSVSPPSPQQPGTTVTLMPSVTGCSNPLYEFWVLPPSGGAWQLLVPYASTKGFTWNNAGLAPGSYRISLWARDASSPGTSGTAPNTYDTFSAFTYTLGSGSGSGPCTGMSATSAPAAAAGPGTQVTVTGVATGCTNPVYEFWLESSSGAWSLVQPYSPNNTLVWKTSGASPGSYRFSVWARDATSSGGSGTPPYTYDTFSAFNYTLTAASCSAISAPVSPSAGANVATTVTITASATGCPNALYALYRLPPNGTWSLVKAYSSNPAFSWDTTGAAAGMYRFSVWTRDASSAASYDAFSAYNYTLASVPCTSMSASASPATATSAGTTVTVTVNAGGCPIAQYEFWLLMPNGMWTLARGYSASGSLTWDTTGMAPGSYRFSVWARDASSAGTGGTAPYTYDAFSAFQYMLS